MKAEDQTKFNNLWLRYQSYDNNGTKYAYDIHFTTLHGGTQMKAKRDTGADNLRQHIEDLMQNFKDVVTIIVSDFTGKSKKCLPINEPVEIRLLDVKNIDTPKVIVHNKSVSQSEPIAQRTDYSGLSGILFAGTRYEGLGELAPYFKGLEDTNTIARITEKNEELARRLAELEQKNEEWQKKYETLDKEHELLQDEADDMEDELTMYRNRENKQDKIFGVLGGVGASIVKNFVRQNPALISGLIPAEQLAGIFAADDAAQATTSAPPTNVSSANDDRADDATIVFDWLQTLDDNTFEKVISIIAVLRQNTAYADLIIDFLKTKKQ